MNNLKVELTPTDIEMLSIFSNGTKTIILECRDGCKYICDKLEQECEELKQWKIDLSLDTTTTIKYMTLQP